MKIMHVGIMSREDYKKSTIAIAKGIYKPKHNEPKVWFESIKSLSQVLSNENQALLKLIIERKPQSLTELEAISHRKKSNLSWTLKTLENYGIVSLDRKAGKVIPTVQAANFKVEFGLNSINY